MKRPISICLRVFLVCLCLASLGSLAASPALAGPSGISFASCAVHVVPHGTSCKSLRTFNCSNINTTHIGTGDIDIVPIFFNVDAWGYTGIEFGLIWPADWGSCSFTPCGTGSTIGRIVNPGDGVVVVWPTCQRPWAVALGYGWLSAQSEGRIIFTDSPLTYRLGVTDCSGQFSAPYDTYSAGIGWIAGDQPCLGGIDPLYVTITDDAPGSCVPTGDTLTYFVHIVNANMYAVNNVVLSDSLPPGAVYVSGGTYIDAGRILRLDLGTIQPGEAETSFTLQIAAPPGATVTNHIAVATRQFWPQPATHSIAVCNPADARSTTWGAIKAIFK